MGSFRASDFAATRLAGRRGRPPGGGRLEAAVIASQLYVVRLEKMYAQAKWVKGRPLAIRGVVDFVGEVCGSGRAICFDCKECADPARFGLDQVAPHQAAYLCRHGEAGAIAGLLIESTAGRSYFWLDWRHLARRLGGTASVRWDDPDMVRLGDPSHLIQWRRIPELSAGV